VTGKMRAAARELQQAAQRYPLGRASRGAHDPRHFAQIDRELIWGLTLNK
jgi:hypothetical protein